MHERNCRDLLPIRSMLLALLLLAAMTIFGCGGGDSADTSQGGSGQTMPGVPNTVTAFTDPTTGMQFVSASGGCFNMGDMIADGIGSTNELPAHLACASDFQIGKYYAEGLRLYS